MARKEVTAMGKSGCAIFNKREFANLGVSGFCLSVFLSFWVTCFFVFHLYVFCL